MIEKLEARHERELQVCLISIFLSVIRGSVFDTF